MWYGRMVDWVVVTGEDGEEAVRGAHVGSAVVRCALEKVCLLINRSLMGPSMTFSDLMQQLLAGLHVGPAR